MYKKNLNDEEKVIYLKALLYILNIDKKMSADKKEYIEEQALEIGFAPEEIKNLKKSKKTEDVIKEIKSIKNLRLKRFILREMVLLAMADHELRDEEIQSIYKIGEGVGVKQEKIDDFFLWAAQGLEWQLDGIKLIEEDI